MTPDYLSKWEHILEDVDKVKVPVQFIKKIVVKLIGKKQHTINIQSLLKQGLDPDEIEEVVSRKLNELDPLINSFEFVLNVESIAETVQPETDKLLGNL
jgi:hypothetical protein